MGTPTLQRMIELAMKLDAPVLDGFGNQVTR